MKALHETDFYEWSLRNAGLLRSGRIDRADIENIAEELEGLALSQKRELTSRLRVLLTHLLKWQFQPGSQSPSWKATIQTQRLEIRDLLDQMPSLEKKASAEIPRIYHEAVIAAEAETGLSHKSFPTACPFLFRQVLDVRFLPKAGPRSRA